MLAAEITGTLIDTIKRSSDFFLTFDLLNISENYSLLGDAMIAVVGFDDQFTGSFTI